MNKNCLIVFAKNPSLGKAKTRLAATIGKEKALSIYLDLLAHTCDISSKANATKVIFYSDFIEENDCWSKNGFQQEVQKGEDLGSKMMKAFQLMFSKGFNKVAIIGTDCLELDTATIDKAFVSLDSKNIVLGPAHDGGYYLLGMKKMEESIFLNMTWSTDTVLKETLSRLSIRKLSVDLLQTLTDIDEEKDLK